MDPVSSLLASSAQEWNDSIVGMVAGGWAEPGTAFDDGNACPLLALSSACTCLSTLRVRVRRKGHTLRALMASGRQAAGWLPGLRGRAGRG